MVNLEDLKPGQSLVGIEPNLVVLVRSVTTLAEGVVELVYRTPAGQLRERLLTRADAAEISPATTERPWKFDGDGGAFQLTCEAKRIDLAFLFDPMMAVHTSSVDPLPHQITAVYQSMLPQQPLRFVLADDPGAGKTIMAGLYIRELILRADSRRILIVAPGSLVEQWKEELLDKFGLSFDVYSSVLALATPGSNPFEDRHHLIIRLDQISRDEVDLPDGSRGPGPTQERLLNAGWDLVVFDEAHKLSAHYFGTKLERTARYRFAERLGRHTRHLLLMTATPHNGKHEDFQLFLALLDSDRFYGKFREQVHEVDSSGLMRRMTKEHLVKFDGTPLFPERRAYTVNYRLSPDEQALYEAVTDYVRTEMGKADELTGARRGSVGFALTSLQRRLASSPEAIFQSLKRRRERLENRLREEQQGPRGRSPLAATFASIPDDEDDLDAAEQEALEESLVDQATAARTVHELQAEIVLLKGLEHQARLVVTAGNDRKWDELSRLLQHTPEMHDDAGRQRKLIVFTEHRDTLIYLHNRIGSVLGNEAAVVTIHGGTNRDERRETQARFRSDPTVRVLVATDAAGEGVNLQTANLMVNYDLPWNPNRLEQRFGRIHRINQTEVCHVWSLVARDTREGEVYNRLLEKIEVESQALNGQVFNILGDVFEETSLKALLIEAIRYNDLPEVRARLYQKIDHAFEHHHLQQLVERNALAEETMSPERLFSVKEEMDRAQARRLQPFFVRSFFLKAFEQLGGSLYPRESGRYEITHVPTSIRERDRRIGGRNRREQEPVLRRYERICFEKENQQPLDRPGLPRAVLMHPGHPLMLSVSDLILEQNANLLRRGAVLLDPSDEGQTPWLLFLLTHEISSGDGSVLSRRLQFVRVEPEGSPSFAGWAPHLDLEPIDAAERPLLDSIAAAPWINSDQEPKAVALAAATLVPQHYSEVATRRIAHVDKTLQAVHERLTHEIDFWSDRWLKLRDDAAAGKDVRLNLENVRRTISDLEGRLDNRKKELQAMRHVVNGTPQVLGGALVVPAGLMRRLRGEEPADPVAEAFAANAAARAKIERLAMEAVRRAEEAAGCHVHDVSAAKCGWDLTSHPPAIDGRQPEARHIEVKGRIQGATTLTVTRNEILYAFNQGDKFVLAIVLVNPDDTTEGPFYIHQPFDQEPGWGVSSVNFNLAELLRKAQNGVAKWT